MRKTIILSSILTLILGACLVFPSPSWGAQCKFTVKNYNVTKLSNADKYNFKIYYTNKTPSNINSEKTIIAKYKDYSNKVYEIEKMLSELDYNLGLSKFYGYRTKLAVKQFQKDMNLHPTGKVDKETYEKLKEVYNIEEPDEKEDTNNNPIDDNQGSDDNNAAQPPAENNNSGENSSDRGGSENASPSELTAEEQKMIDLVNQERVQRNLSPLEADPELVETARLKSIDMNKNNYFAHQSPTYGSPFNLLKSEGISYRTAGENLAGAPTVESAHKNLMNSPGHKANILNPNFTHIGVGIVDGNSYGKLFTEHFVGR